MRWLMGHQRGRVWSAVLAAALSGSGCGMGAFLKLERQDVDERLIYFLGAGNSAALFHGPDALLVDPKFWNLARHLRFEIEQGEGRTVRRVLITHSHRDHSAGVGLYRQVGAVMVHPNTRRRLEREGLTAPWVEVSNEIRLVLGGEPVRILHPGPGHTDGDLVALLESRRVLVTGDVYLSGFEPLVDGEAGGNLLALRAALDRLVGLEFDQVLPGHGEPVGRDELVRTRDYLVALEGAVRESRRAGLTEDAAVGSVTLPQMFRPVPFAADRERSVRLMYRAVAGEAHEQPSAGRRDR